MPPPTLSVIVITKNEAAHIEACLKSVAFADESIVVDSGSSDATPTLAASMGARVVRTDDWPGFGAQKNRALALARGDWVLSIDADERVGDELAAEIRAVVQRNDSAGPTGYELNRLSSFCGQWMRHGDWYPDRVLRLFRRGAGRFSDDLVHERLLVDGHCARLNGELLHFTMYRTPGKPEDRYGFRHPGGLAIDLGAVKKSNGEWLSVGPHWPSEIGAKTCGDGARKLLGRRGRELMSILCEVADQRIFHYMLSPHFDEPHSDHFHLEIKPGVKWFLVN